MEKGRRPASAPLKRTHFLSYKPIPECNRAFADLISLLLSDVLQYTQSAGIYIVSVFIVCLIVASLVFFGRRL